MLWTLSATKKKGILADQSPLANFWSRLLSQKKNLIALIVSCVAIVRFWSLVLTQRGNGGTLLQQFGYLEDPIGAIRTYDQNRIIAIYETKTVINPKKNCKDL